MMRHRPLWLLATLLAAACDRPSGPRSPAILPLPATVAPPVPPVAAPPQAAEPATIRFRDATAGSGIDFVHASGNDPKKHFPTSLGSGVALLDYDGDGRLDIYFCTTRSLPLDAPDPSRGNRLYRNLGGLKFQDVTDSAGVGHNGFCHGAAVGDADNDGRPDLYLPTLGRNVLYRNRGDGTFADITAGSGVESPGWSSGAAFLDYDGDGVLDLYVSRYAEYDPSAEQPFCGDRQKNVRIICSPFSLTPARHSLYKGRGDGTFVETTVAAGLTRRDGRGLGVVAADVDGDGRTDIYVANDGCPKFLYRNKGDGTFEDISESSGADRNAAGEVQGSMGVDIQDLDGDGRPELFVTNFRGQYNTLYRNLDGRTFQDASAEAGVVRDSLAYVGWGCGLADLDNDGRPDLLVVNGEVDDNLRELGQEATYEQPAFVWWQRPDGKFIRVADPGPYFRVPHPARGAAFGDLDDDGDLDVVVSHMQQAPALLVNESKSGHWLRVVCKPSKTNRSAIGAAVEVVAGGRSFHRQVKGGDSYLSANDPRPLIGLGPIDRVDRVVVRWPGGKTSTVEGPPVDRTVELVEP